MGRRREITLYIGGVYASREPVVIKTLLGSCIAVCLFDPSTTIGGMNHFMLPESAGDEDPDFPSRFGIYAMDLLIRTMLKLGADRDRFLAKVFGGSHVLPLAGVGDEVPRRNIDFARRFLRAEGIPILLEDVGGDRPRRVSFETDTGRTFVRRVDGRLLSLLIEEEGKSFCQPSSYGSITLFEDEENSGSHR